MTKESAHVHTVHFVACAGDYLIEVVHQSDGAGMSEPSPDGSYELGTLPSVPPGILGKRLRVARERDATS